ncbi:hypothetical protein CRUP_035624 [Coryphaenoides rupestris]|nr:hypothetical protein CRUP_035624 [Coryphaenoides rupestris]
MRTIQAMGNVFGMPPEGHCLSLYCTGESCSQVGKLRRLQRHANSVVLFLKRRHKRNSITCERQ